VGQSLPVHLFQLFRGITDHVLERGVWLDEAILPVSNNDPHRRIVQDSLQPVGRSLKLLLRLLTCGDVLDNSNVEIFVQAGSDNAAPKGLAVFTQIAFLYFDRLPLTACHQLKQL